MRSFVLSLLALTACGPVEPKEPYCVTSMGMRYMGTWKAGELIEASKFTCDYFDKAQNKLIQSIGTTYSKELNLDATRLMGVEIWLRTTENWYDDYGRKVAGQSFCALGYIHINNDIKAEWSSFPHEMLHIMQGCASPAPIDKGLDEDHSNWQRDGFYDAIEASTTYLNLEP